MPVCVRSFNKRLTNLLASSVNKYLINSVAAVGHWTKNNLNRMAVRTRAKPEYNKLANIK